MKAEEFWNWIHKYPNLRVSVEDLAYVALNNGTLSQLEYTKIIDSLPKKK